ncbi:hypothetical protein D6D01_10071 [Aureobasidium pullulans]|uniref:Uncharacterized protein n=1 Tax=Aureobasidium pullulans TaxID=5580 RepID=A0A4S9JTD8_AURPU|nr:hypothetical protein D6D01_10071 [Aureobasidium pullulans]
MAAPNTTTDTRVTQIKDCLAMNKIVSLSLPFDPDSTIFSPRKYMPNIPCAPEGDAWVWGDNDNFRRPNLLTPTRVAAAGKETRSGEILPVNLPLNILEIPAFDREVVKHEIKVLAEDVAYDDVYHLNTRSGTRSMASVALHTFFRERSATVQRIHHWAVHVIAGRAILLDYRDYAHKEGINYDPPYEYYLISFEELEHCAADQGINIRPAAQDGDINIGDILFVRTGWVEAHHGESPAERNELAVRPHALGKDDGLSQEERMLDWLHGSYFSAVDGDAPAFEAWPTHEEYHLPRVHSGSLGYTLGRDVGSGKAVADLS